MAILDINARVAEAKRLLEKNSQQKLRTKEEVLQSTKKKYLETKKQIESIDRKIEKLQKQKEVLIQKNLNRREYYSSIVNTGR